MVHGDRVHQPSPATFTVVVNKHIDRNATITKLTDGVTVLFSGASVTLGVVCVDVGGVVLLLYVGGRRYVAGGGGIWCFEE